MIDSGDKLKLDQNHVETVIPAPGKPGSTEEQLQLSRLSLWPHPVIECPAGKKVLILNGSYRDTEALLEGIDEKNFCATLTLDSVSVYLHVTVW